MKRALLSLIAVSVAAKLLVIWSGLCERGVIADDAYYFFTIAKNIGDGFGPTFDRISPTNGFHPLWQFAIVPLFSTTSDLWIPIRAALTLSLVFDVISGIIIVDLARRVGRPDRAGLIAAALWFLFPITAFLGLRGMESSLSTVLVLLSLRLTLTAVDQQFSWRSAFPCGIAFALSGLARTDNLPCVGLAILMVVMVATRPESRRRGCYWLLVTGATAVLLVAPWLLWNLDRFGSIVQVSGLIKLHTRYLFGALPDWGTTPEAGIRALAHRVFAPVLVPVRFLLGEEFKSTALTPVITFLAIAVYALPVCLQAGRFVRDRKALPVFVFAMTWMIAHVALYGFVWGSYASWYSLTFMALLTFVTAASLSGTEQPHRRRANVFSLVSAGGVAIAIYAALFGHMSRKHKTPEELLGRKLSAIRAGAPDAVIGAFNAGAVGYVGTHHGLRVVNLDGLVNNKVYEALQSGRYLEYVQETVDVMFETPQRAAVFLGPQQLQELHRAYSTYADGLWYRSNYQQR
jgi:hypothetical protein